MTKEQLIRGREISNEIENIEKQIKSLNDAISKIQNSTNRLRLQVEVNDLSSFGAHYPSDELSQKFLNDLVQEYKTNLNRFEEELSKI